MLNKIFAKLTNKHFLSLLGNGAMALFSVITYAILYRVLTPEEMGNWVFFQFVIIFFETIRTGFLQNALILFYAGAEKDQAKKIAGSCWFIAIVLTAAFLLLNFIGVIGFQFISTSDPSVLLLVNWFGLSLLATLPYNISSWISQAEERFDLILYIRIINQGSFIIFVIILLLLESINLETIVYAYLGSSILTSLFSIFAGWSGITHFACRTKESINQIFNYGKYSVGTVLSSNLLKSSDSFIIKVMLGPAALAIYNVPQRLLDIVEVPLRSFVATAMPEMSTAHKQNNKEKVLMIMKKYSGLLTALLVPVSIGAIVFADLIVLIIGGEQYVDTEAANIFRIFMIFGIFFPIDRFLGITLDMINQPQLNLIKVIIMLGVNIVGDIVGIQLFDSLYAVAVVTIFAFLAGVWYGYKSLKRYLDFTIADILSSGYKESKIFIANLLQKKSS